MASNYQAALLDQLFGINRNNRAKAEMTWEDEEVCKHYLSGFCPHELFVNTRLSLGECSQIHDTKLLEAYKNSRKYFQMGYEQDLVRLLSSYQTDVNKRIESNKERLKGGLRSGHEIVVQNRILSLEQEINDIVYQIEDLGNKGEIDACKNLNFKLEEKQKNLKYDKIEMENHKLTSKDKLEEVCEVCSAYISKNDPSNSVENHLQGRIHTSYAQLSTVLNDLDKAIKENEEKTIDNKHVIKSRNRRDYRGIDDEYVERRERSYTRDRENDRYRERSNDSERDRGRRRDSKDRTSKRRHQRSRSSSRSYRDRNRHRESKSRYD